MASIKLAYNKKEYTLAYTREVVRQMEAQGFQLNELTEKPVTMIPLLWEGAFRVYHKGLKRNLVSEIFENIGNKSDLIIALSELYSETINTLVEDNAEGNATWELNR